MSTYIDPRQPNKHGDYKDCPELVVRYLYDSETIRGLSPRTVNGYYIDLRTFFRFLMPHKSTNECKSLSGQRIFYPTQISKWDEAVVWTLQKDLEESKWMLLSLWPAHGNQ